MVNSVSSTPYFSYLNQLQGGQAARGALPKGANVSATQTSGQSSALVNPLLGKGGFAPSVLSLLQESGSGKFDPIANILGGQSASDGLTKLLANVYDSSAAASFQQAQLSSPKQVAVTSPVQNLISDAVKASTAYNKTLQQNAANLVKESKARTDNVTQLVS